MTNEVFRTKRKIDRLDICIQDEDLPFNKIPPQ